MSEKIALVTGATRGLGLEFVRQLLELKYQAIACGRDILANEPLQTLSKKYGSALYLKNLDVSSEKSIKDLSIDLKFLSQLDLLICNAGIFEGGESLDSVSLEALNRSFLVNSIAPLQMSKYFLSLLKKSPKPICANITSLMGSITDNSSGGYYAYRMSKAALNMFNKSFSKDHPDLISVVLHPGWVQTDMGGKNAKITAETSVSGMLKIIHRLSHKDTGEFFNYDGSHLPW